MHICLYEENVLGSGQLQAAGFDQLSPIHIDHSLMDIMKFRLILVCTSANNHVTAETTRVKYRLPIRQWVKFPFPIPALEFFNINGKTNPENKNKINFCLMPLRDIHKLRRTLRGRRGSTKCGKGGGSYIL